jgi:hypothetical protein
MNDNQISIPNNPDRARNLCTICTEQYANKTGKATQIKLYKVTIVTTELYKDLKVGGGGF